MALRKEEKSLKIKVRKDNKQDSRQNILKATAIKEISKKKLKEQW